MMLTLCVIVLANGDPVRLELAGRDSRARR